MILYLLLIFIFIGPFVPALTNTLFAKIECQHEPYAPGAVNLNYVKCKKCGEPLEATWKVKC